MHIEYEDAYIDTRYISMQYSFDSSVYLNNINNEIRMLLRLVEPETESHTSREAGTMPQWPLALIAMAVGVVT